MSSGKGAMRGVRNDRLRRLVKHATAQGWVASVDGRGHVRVQSPTGGWFTVSATSAGSAVGHTYENTKASARKAGLDVSGL